MQHTIGIAFTFFKYVFIWVHSVDRKEVPVPNGLVAICVMLQNIKQIYILNHIESQQFFCFNSVIRGLELKFSFTENTLAQHIWQKIL
jgi:hypothetical protein